MDYAGSWGPMIMRYDHHCVIESIKAQLEQGISFGAPTIAETKPAEKICKSMPSIEKVRMVNSPPEKSDHECNSSDQRLHKTS
ncbi:MAG: hypothetical protein OXD32_02110 [Endozoicomonadaceae bacterium]|nr:hypothetical protein [Endozoicomonadaceae bacterium]